MEPDEEPEPGSSSQSQNLQDLQNYLVTFNKDIGSGDDVLPNMDVDTSVGDVGDLYGPTSENSLQEAADTGVSSQFSSGFYSEQGMLDTTLSDEPGHQIQNLVPSSGDGDTEINDIKPEVSSLDLEGVSAQIAGFADGQLSHAISGIQAGSLSQGLIMTPLAENQGKVLRILSFGGEDGQFLMADGQPMQVISSEDLGLTADGLVDATGEVSLDINSASSLIATGNVDSPMSLPSLHTSAGDTASTSSIAITQAHSSGSSTNLIANTSGSGTAILNPTLGQLVTLQGAGEGGQSQLVSLQGEAIQADDLQMPSLLGGEAINAELGYQTITILPSDLTQPGEMNYVLILSQPGGGRDSVASVAQVYDFKQENQDYSEEMLDESGDSKRALRFMPKKMGMTQIGHQQLMCAFCSYTSPKRYLLTRHMRSHSDERPFKCQSCDRGFKTSASLLNHVNTHTGTRPHKCKTCEAAFTTSGELVRHIRYRHTFEKPHRCPECDYASVELSKLKRHMRSHTGERPYKCPNCPYASPDTYKLKRHMRIHTGEKPYECDHCHARFTQSNSLKAHKLIHTGNKPVYQCTLCPTTCGRKTDLKIHFNKLHSTGLPLECRKCGKTYSDRYSYKQHLRTHDVEKCYKCENCNFIAANEKSLHAHTLGRCCGKARCDECSMTFTSQKQFERHMALAHPNSQTNKKMDSDEKILDEDDDEDEEPGISAADKSCEDKLTPSLANEGHGGESEESNSSQVIITPLASDTLHKNLIQDIKEGKLGDVPQVVIVHPDGSQEEISSKLATDKWNVEDNLVPVTASEESARLDSRAQEMSAPLSGDAIAPATSGDALFLASKGRESLSGQEGQLFNHSESSQHCEAATQVEIESDADSSSDITSFDNAPQQKGETEESTEHLTKVLQENAGSLFSMDSSVKSSLVVSDLTQAIKTSTSGSPLYLKTLINKSSGVQSITSLSSPQLQSQPSVVKVIPATSTVPVSTGSSRGQQFSLFSSSIPCVNTVSSSNAKTSISSSADKNFVPKVYVSLSSLSGHSSKPPIQLMAGDSLSLPIDSGHGDSIGMLGLDELPSSSSEQLQGRLDLELEDSDSCIDIKDLKAVDHKALSVSPQLHSEPNEQTIKLCNMSTSLTHEDSTSTHSCQNSLQNVNSSLAETNSVNSVVMRQSCESQSPNLEQNLISNSVVQPCPTSFLDHGADSLIGQDSSSTLIDQTLGPHESEVAHFESGQISASDMDSENRQHSYTVTKPYSQPSGHSPPKVHESPLVETFSEESPCDNSGEKTGPEPNSVLSNSPLQRENRSTASCESKEPAPSCSVDISKKSGENTSKDTGSVEATEVQVADLQPIIQSKSARPKSSKRRNETDATLVMTGKRQRKALVKVSL